METGWVIGLEPKALAEAVHKRSVPLPDHLQHRKTGKVIVQSTQVFLHRPTRGGEVP